MQEKPSVSVVVPTYNRANTLGRTLESILAQTFADYEIIVIDDGSTDATGDVIKQFLPSERIIYIRQPNQGVAAARNAGVRNSKGEYVAFCDSDDYWVPEKLDRQMPLFGDGIGMVFSDIFLFSQCGKVKAKGFDIFKPYRGEVYGPLLRGNFITTSSVVVKKSLLSRPFCGQTCEDWQMWLSIAKEARADYVDEPLVHYYEHSDGLSKAKLRFYESRLSVRRNELRLLQKELPVRNNLIKSLRRLMLKDRLLILILAATPTPLLKRLSASYYENNPFRKTLKAVIGD